MIAGYRLHNFNEVNEHILTDTCQRYMGYVNLIDKTATTNEKKWVLEFTIPNPETEHTHFYILSCRSYFVGIERDRLEFIVHKGLKQIHKVEYLDLDQNGKVDPDTNVIYSHNYSSIVVQILDIIREIYKEHEEENV